MHDACIRLPFANSFHLSSLWSIQCLPLEMKLQNENYRNPTERRKKTFRDKTDYMVDLCPLYGLSSCADHGTRQRDDESAQNGNIKSEEKGSFFHLSCVPSLFSKHNMKQKWYFFDIKKSINSAEFWRHIFFYQTPVYICLGDTESIILAPRNYSRFLVGLVFDIFFFNIYFNIIMLWSCYSF